MIYVTASFETTQSHRIQYQSPTKEMEESTPPFVRCSSKHGLFILSRTCALIIIYVGKQNMRDQSDSNRVANGILVVRT